MIADSSKELFRYEDYPIIGCDPLRKTENTSTTLSHTSNEQIREISFSGRRQNCVVCFIDMMNSTKVTSTLSESELTRYYAIFLNAMASIVKNFGSTIIKNAGDCLIYYYPKTNDRNNIMSFKDVIECGLTMIAAHQYINIKLHEARLPVLDYRISADYGNVSIGWSTSSRNYDLFGSAMNICAKINSKAPANGMVLGDNLYQIVKSIPEYDFEKIGEYPTTSGSYSMYVVSSEKVRNILNPFERTSE